MTQLGLAAIVIGGLVVAVRRNAVWWLIGCAAALPASAVVVVGGNAINPFYFYSGILVGTLLLLGGSRARGGERTVPGEGVLLVFAAVSLLTTAIAPSLFAGLLISSPRPEISAFAPLKYTASNAAQVVYLVLAIALVIYMARQALPRHLLSVAFGVGVVLDTVRYVTFVTGAPFPAQFINNSTVRYIDTDAAGHYRLRGVFAEPSELSVFTIGALAFFLASASGSRGRQRVTHLVLAGCCILDLTASNSATAVVTAIVLGIAAIAVLCKRFLMNGARAPIWVITMSPVLVLAAVLSWRYVFTPFQLLLSEKLVSSSYATRSTLDAQALSVLTHTFGLGAGLGSNRPSSLITSLLSCVGFVGTVLFACYVGILLKGAWRDPLARPVAWALIALLTAKAIGSPDLSTPILWLVIGVCAQIRNGQRRTAAPGDPAPKGYSLSVSSARALSGWDAEARTSEQILHDQRESLGGAIPGEALGIDEAGRAEPQA